MSGYRFQWHQLCDAWLRGALLGDGEDQGVGCVLSRVVLWDRDLQRKSEEVIEGQEFSGGPVWKKSAGGDKAKTSTSLESATEGMTLEEGELPEEGEVVLPPLTPDAWAQLPTEFGGKGSKFSAAKDKKKKSKSNEWLKTASWDEYWQCCGLFIIYNSWLADFGGEMAEGDREGLEKQVEQYRHAVLEEQEQPFTGLTAAHPSRPSLTDYASIFELHCKLCEERAGREHALYKAQLARHRCEKFVQKMDALGYVSGIAIKPSTSDGEKGAVEEKEKEQPPFKRAPMVYDENDVFTDVLCQYYDPYAEKMKCVWNKKEGAEPKEAESVAVVEQFPAQPIDIKNVRFAFDPETERELLAKEAYKYYKDDVEIRKYWYQRYRLFSKLDKGVIMDREGWFSVTPERIAEHIADRMVRRPNVLIVDAFAGVGGNSIQLALRGARVIAIDLDPVRLKCAKRNAEVYGVADRIEFICGNFFHVVDRWTAGGGGVWVDGVFLSPPWGGPSYLNAKEFDLSAGMTPCGIQIFEAAKAMSPNIAYFLPRNTKMKQLISLAGAGGRVEVEQSCLNRKVKTITAYYGEYAAASE